MSYTSCTTLTSGAVGFRSGEGCVGAAVIGGETPAPESEPEVMDGDDDDCLMEPGGGDGLMGLGLSASFLATPSIHTSVNPYM